MTIFSVWDGDWAILEEYDANGNRVEGYVQGYHGLVKTLVTNIYYYQDELGSRSHIASGTGSLIESYQYDVYGKPRVYNASGVYQAGATPVARDLFTGQRWVVEIGLYDDRNRFMSPDLGRFLQPDPIGFKGDASNLYRYCGNDWANKTDPLGLLTGDNVDYGTKLLKRDDRSFQETLMAWEMHMEIGGAPQASTVEANPIDKKGIEATQKSVNLMNQDPLHTPQAIGVLKDKDGNLSLTQPAAGQPQYNADGKLTGFKEKIPSYDRQRYSLVAIGHSHPFGEPFSRPDVWAANDFAHNQSAAKGLHPIPIYKNHPGTDAIIDRYTPSENLSERQQLRCGTVSELWGDASVKGTYPAPWPPPD